MQPPGPRPGRRARPCSKQPVKRPPKADALRTECQGMHETTFRAVRGLTPNTSTCESVKGKKVNCGKRCVAPAKPHIRSFGNGLCFVNAVLHCKDTQHIAAALATQQAFAYVHIHLTLCPRTHPPRVKLHCTHIMCQRTHREEGKRGCQTCAIM